LSKISSTNRCVVFYQWSTATAWWVFDNRFTDMTERQTDRTVAI